MRAAFVLLALGLAGSVTSTTEGPHPGRGALGRSAGGASSEPRRPIERSRAALELALYGEDSVRRREAALALARLRRVTVARAILDAAGRRPPSSDRIAADTLAEIAFAEGPGAGHRLLAAVRSEADRAIVDRLLAIYSAQVDPLEARLAVAGPDERSQIATRLGALAPLAMAALERLVERDPDPNVRATAAIAIASGEGRPLLAEVTARLGSKSPLAPAFVGALRRCFEPRCGELLERLVAQPTAAPGARLAAVRALAASSRGSDRLWRALFDAWDPALRLGLLEASAELPRKVSVLPRVREALASAEPSLAAAAATSVGRLQDRASLEPLGLLLEHPEPEVRLAAVGALSRIARAGEEAPLARLLGRDPDAAVRVEAARALGVIGGPHAASALSTAAARDESSVVRRRAGDSLRALGFRR